MNGFEVISTFQPQGDQPQAIDKLVAGLQELNQEPSDTY